MNCPLLINEPPLQVLPSLALKVGLNEAIILQQVHYWLNPKFNKNYFEGRYWVWNTYDQWRQQFPFWGEKTIRRSIAHLEELGVLLTFITRDFKKLKYYSIDYDVLKLVQGNLQKDALTTKETLGSNRSGHFDPIDLPEGTDRRRQSDRIDPVKVTTSYNKDTEITSSEKTLLSSLSKQEEEDFKIMIHVWNQVVQAKVNPGKDVYPTSERYQALQRLIKEVWQGQATEWEKFCHQIANSRFLMGQGPSGFKITLDWALVPRNACKILEGAIYDKETNFSSRSCSDVMKEIGKHHSPEWIPVVESLIQDVGPVTYQSWFAHVRFEKPSNHTVIVWVENDFKKDYIHTHYKAVLDQIFRCLDPKVEKIEFQVLQTPSPTL